MDTPGNARGTTLRAELPRKVVHAAVGLCALLLRWVPPWIAWIGAAAAVLFNALFVHRVTGGIFLREHEREQGFSTGVVLYPAAVLGLLVVFFQQLELAAAAWGILAFGDAAATLAGLAVGGPALPWNPRKRWSGLVAFIVVGTVAAALLLQWTELGSSPWVSGALRGSTIFLWTACMKAAGAAALVESLDTGWDDNFLLAAAAAAVLWMWTLVDPALLLSSAPILASGFVVGASLTALPALAAWWLRAVSAEGAVAGWVLTALLYGASGWRGVVVFGAFFVLGSAATRVGWTKKVALGVAQERGGRRGIGNALSNTLVGLLCALLAMETHLESIFAVGMVAAFATAAFDTVASEIGQAFGRETFLLTEARRVPPGTVGAVSLEGTTAGLVAAAAVGLTGLAVGVVTPSGAGAVVLGALVGSTAESWAAALLPAHGAHRAGVLNFLNTAAGAAAACGAYIALGI
ncbi:MAG: DUF92 domain-containing protein [Gemmatimonadetes bacterium]|nr:DUF92 domain-containing protein [Gemmatimonadota bacterium]